MYSTTPDRSVLRDAGILTLAELAELTPIPSNTLYSWVRKGWLAVVRIDGTSYSTLQAVTIAAGEAARSKEGRPRSWTLAPLEDELASTAP